MQPQSKRRATPKSAPITATVIRLPERRSVFGGVGDSVSSGAVGDGVFTVVVADAVSSAVVVIDVAVESVNQGSVVPSSGSGRVVHGSPGLVRVMRMEVILKVSKFALIMREVLSLFPVEVERL